MDCPEKRSRVGEFVRAIEEMMTAVGSYRFEEPQRECSTT